MRVVLTGATGFLGRHTLPVLVERYGKDNVVPVGSKDYDLMNTSEVERLFADHKPDVVVHFAAYSGGIGANRKYPADFYFRNTILTALTFEAAARHQITKLVYPFGGCSYPAAAVSPIGEDQLWTGYPQPESAPYSTAKMMGTVAGSAYRTQYGLHTSLLIPGNLYGEYDNFSTLDSHVVPAMIRRFYEARESGANEVTLWGNGKPQRDFVYAGDVARLIPYFIDKYDSMDWVNLSSGVSTSIAELAGTVAKLVGYHGRLAWDTSKPNGQMVKIFDTKRLASLGLSCPTALADGVARTVRWFAKNYDAKTDGIRL